MGYFVWVVVLLCLAMHVKGSNIANNGALPSICGQSGQLAADANEAYQNATCWLLSQRTQDWSWPLLSTATAILSLQITNASWYSRGTDDLTAQLSVNRLEIELLVDMVQATSPDTLATLSPGSLAYFIMALNSTCHDVTIFYGKNLVEILENSMDNYPQGNFNNYFQYGLALLALCQSGGPIKDAYIQEIMDGQSNDGGYQFGTDVVSMALMAMACIQDQVPRAYQKEFTQKMKRSINFILTNQNNDYTFGNPISTALAAQALLAANRKNANSWNCEEAVRSVLDAQGPDGDFGGQGGTIPILPLLVGETFASVKDVSPDCDADDLGPGDDPGDDVLNITITIQVENGVDTNTTIFNISVVVPEGSTLYEAMVLAEKQYPGNFSFESRLTQFGNSIDKIRGVANDADKSYYWTILIGQGRISAATGVDGIDTEDQELYIFFYRSFA